MKLEFDASTERLRAELRAWLDANAPTPAEFAADPPRSSAHMPEWARSWQRRLFDAGWLVPGWPPELGGRNATPVEQLVYFEELAARQVIRSYNVQGLTIIVPSIRDYGSDAQREAYLVPSLRGEYTWCLGMSEPNAGSDLASLSTSAELQGDHFVVNGQKVWTSGAADADLCLCFVRTDPQVPKHRGISVLIIDMRSPGIDVRPLPELSSPSRADFCEVFLDDVEVPRANLVGVLHDGWRISAGSLAHERGMLWVSQSARMEQKLDALIALGKRPAPGGGRLGDDARFRDGVASIYVEAQALKFMGYSGFAKVARDEGSPEHSTLKLLGSEIDQRLCLFALDTLGPDALDVRDDAGPHNLIPDPSGRGWSYAYLRTFTHTIAGGTSEIQRNIIAQRVLGLPRA